MRLTDTQSRIIFGTSFTASILLIFWRINRWSFWFDESYTSALIDRSPSDIISLTGVDVHPPLYYLILDAWAALFGATDFTLRLFSALCMLLSILLLVNLLKRLMEKRYAYVAASFAALAPFTIRFAQEARMYALLSAILVGATYIFVIQMQRKRRQRSWQLWILYALLMTAALYTHYFSILILFAHVAYALFHDTRTKDGKTWLIRLKNRITLIDRRFLKSLVLIPILFAPWLPTLWEQFNTVNEGFWIPPVSLTSIISLFSMLSVFNEIRSVDMSFFVGYGLLIGFGVVIYHVVRRAKDEERRSLWFILACVLFPMLLLAVISWLPMTSSYLYWRYFSQFSLFFYAGVLFVGLLSLKYLRGAVGIIIISAIVGLHVVGTSRVLMGADKRDNTTKSQFLTLQERQQPGDIIVAGGLFEWYNARHYNFTDEPVRYIDTGYLWGSHAPIYESDINYLVREDLSDIQPTSGRVWVIESADSPQAVPDNWLRTMNSIYGQSTNIVLYEVQ